MLDNCPHVPYSVASSLIGECICMYKCNLLFYNGSYVNIPVDFQNRTIIKSDTYFFTIYVEIHYKYKHII